MKRYTYKCNDCQAKFEVIIEDTNNIACPSCNGKNLGLLDEEDIEISGCGDCDGCSGCR